MSWDGPGWTESDTDPWRDTAINPTEAAVTVTAEVFQLVELLPKRRDGFTHEARATIGGRDTGARFDLAPAGPRSVRIRVKRPQFVSTPATGEPGSEGDTWQLRGPAGAYPQLWNLSELAAAIAVETERWDRSRGPLRFEWGRRPR